MVAGMERYYQIARCYRDEDFRADRQPEFTQLDIEMSFVDQDDVIAVAEDVLVALWRLIGYDVPDAAAADDLCRGDGPVRLRQARPPDGAGARRLHVVLLRHGVPGVPGALRRCGRDARWRRPAAPAVRRLAGVGQAARCPRPGLRHGRLADGELGGPVAKNLSDSERAGLAAHVGARPRRLRLLRSGPGEVQPGAARRGPAGDRTALAADPFDRSDKSTEAWSFLWVVDAPLFEPADEATAAGDVAVGSGQWTAVHHAFTSPQDLDTFDQDPADALAWAYDIVCNGNEIGGGSIRIHRGDIQRRVFAVMGLDEEEAQEKFGFLLDAFQYGAPPHGGIAFGWDRIVALLSRADSIRDVIAFPKSGGGLRPAHRCPCAHHAQIRGREAGVDSARWIGPMPETESLPRMATCYRLTVF